jgi:tetraacyldisaccharide 4'-kinase
LKRLDSYWQTRNPVALTLLPLSWLFCASAVVRRLAYGRGWLRMHRLPVPVIVVGNITVGGTGKTPLVIRLVAILRSLGLRPGVVSRGYGGRVGQGPPRRVTPESDPGEVGDEPVLIARRCGVPVWVSPRRAEAGRALLAHSDCVVLICDDGLQHYALARDLEIAVMDGRGAGNGLCLPAGPLREPLGRLGAVDLRVLNGGDGEDGALRMQLHPGQAVSLRHPDRAMPLAAFAGQRVHALAGIGHPARFFATLREAGVEPIEHPFPDHHAYSPADIRFGDGCAVLMTEKDAVKCGPFAGSEHWAVPVDAQLEAAFERRLGDLLGGSTLGQTTARHSGMPDLQG